MGDRRSKIVAVLLSLWVAALVAPAAAPALGEPDTGGFATFRLKASNGYSMMVVAISQPGYKRGEVVLWLWRKDAFVNYVSPAKVTDTTIDADLGALGRIALEFQPTGSMGKAAPVCEPDQKVSYEKGSYVGEMEFRGEEGYTDVSVTRVPLSLHPYINFICGGLSLGEGFGPGLPGARLTATARLSQGRVSLQVNQNRPGARVPWGTSIDERRGRIQIGRAVGGTFPATAFHFDPKLRSAHLKPAAPFSGFALFRRHAELENRWTGSLAVDFPGNSNVSLVGARFEAHLRRARLVRERARPTALRPSLLPWLSTKPSPTAFATSSFLGLK